MSWWGFGLFAGQSFLNFLYSLHSHAPPQATHARRTPRDLYTTTPSLLIVLPPLLQQATILPIITVSMIRTV